MHTDFGWFWWGQNSSQVAPGMSQTPISSTLLPTSLFLLGSRFLNSGSGTMRERGTLYDKTEFLLYKIFFAGGRGGGAGGGRWRGEV
jgi:hypothetical protein